MAHLRGRQQDTAGDDLAAQVAAGMKIGEGADGDQPMTRPGPGTVGRRYGVRTNTFKISPPAMVCYQYDVKIEPGEPKTPPRLNREIFNFLDKQLNVFGGIAVAYDGRSMMFSPRRLPANEGQFSITLPDEDGTTGRNNRAFSVKIRFTRPIDLAQLGIFVRGEGRGTSTFPDQSAVQSAIQALNVLIQHGPSMLHPNRAASFFVPPDNPRAASIGKGLEMWRGFYSSLRMGPGTMYLNLDIASQPLVQSGSLPDVVLDFLRGSSRNISMGDLSAARIPGPEMIRLNRFLRGLKVQLVVADQEGIKPTRKIRSIEAFAANDTSRAFEVNGQMMTVEQFFQNHYNVRLRRPDFPCISVSKIALWPLELCHVETGQKWSKKLDPAQTADAIRLTTVEPRGRVGMLSEGLKRIQPSETALGQWEVAIDQQPMEVEARELPPPTIQYKRGIRPREGVWDVKGQHFHTTTRINSMLVIVFDSSQFFSVTDAQTCMVGLITACTRLGIQIADRQPAIHYWPNGADIPSFIHELGKDLIQRTGIPPDLIVCFLPRKPCDTYGEIKRFGDQSMGVATQCMFENKAKKGGEPYFNNLALKVNVKLQGGINSVLLPSDLGPIAQAPTMVCGGDVSHASPGSPNPSVAAVVGSMDPTASIYGSAITVQPSRLELIARLEEMMLKLLRQFFERNKVLPERILFFRDGISEGQFSHVLAGEVKAIRMAAAQAGQATGQAYDPKLTFICCGKRHHISMFPSNPRDADGKTGNAKSGTVVDNGIVSPFHFDWYCMSHKALLGTGRSAHHTVLVDDSNFTADQLQPLVFHLCFTYAKATRAVSVPTPAFYASRLCTRAQLLLSQEDDRTTVISSTSDSSQERARQRALIEAQGRLKDIHPEHKERLFFL
ncbi:hypothetical protein JCM10908_006374 [Rhodotorula pacifica]|uniref:argonaute/piwi family protein n=1 Tax=Rhodotorula pacifica TaxID=1495444 RepID=UPI00317AEADD